MCCGGGLGTATLVQRVGLMIDLTPYMPAGDGVWWGQGGAEPEPLVNALLDQVDDIGPIRAFCGLTWNERLSRRPARVGLTRDVSRTAASASCAGCSRHGLLDVVPCHYSALPRMFAEGLLPRDVGLVQVSPPDADGTVSLGIGVEYVADALQHTRTLIAEINHRMPATVGLRASSAVAVRRRGRDRPAAARGTGPRAGRRGPGDRRERRRSGRGRRHPPARGRLAAERRARRPRRAHGPRLPHRHDHRRRRSRWSRRASSPGRARRSTQASSSPARRSAARSCTTGCADFPVEFRAGQLHARAGASCRSCGRWSRSTRRSRSTCSARSAPSCAAASTSAPSAARSTSAGRPR